MENTLTLNHYDLVSPDGNISEILSKHKTTCSLRLTIENILPNFVGFQIPQENIIFNFKSTLAQLGLNATLLDLELSVPHRKALCTLELKAFGPIAENLLQLLSKGAFLGKLFAADDRRVVRNPDYLLRMFGRSDTEGRPLLSLGGMQGSDELILDKVNGRTVAFLALLEGTVTYDSSTYGFLPTVAKGLHDPGLQLRKFLKLHQEWVAGYPRTASEENIFLVKTLPLHIRTAFARVVQELLPTGVFHTSASILQPDTTASGDVYELFGSSTKELRDMPLEFYTLEPYREHVFFSDRDQLQTSLDDSKILFHTFETAPAPIHHQAATFVVKGSQLLDLKPTDWISGEPRMSDFPGVINPERQSAAVEKYIYQQPSYPFLKAIEKGTITSEGILLTRYFPSPLLKQMLLNDQIHRFLKRIYFQFPSRTYGEFFSHEDRSMLLDLAKFGIPTYWVDKTFQSILQYLPKSGKDSGMFVPLASTETFLKATLFGIYGSNLLDIGCGEELTKLFQGVLKLQKEMRHPLLNPDTPLALVTGGGPGSMSLGNQVAKSLGILSCANIMDFLGKKGAVISKQLSPKDESFIVSP